MRELILYVAKASENDQTFGAVKLDKILFYADFLSYLKHGVSITGQEYFAIQEGPAPKRFLPITKKMIVDGDLAYQIIETRYSNPKKKPIALRPPDLRQFEGQDIAVVGEVLEKFRGVNGSQLSLISHKFAGWIASFGQGKGTIIPYAMVRFDPKGFWGIEPPALSQSLISHGKKLAGGTLNAA